MIKELFIKIYKHLLSSSGKATLVLLMLWGFIKYVIRDDNFTSGITTEFLGIILTINFIQVLFDNENEKVLQKGEIDKIKKIDKILQVHIEKYILDFYEVTTPSDKKDYTKVQMSQEFSMSDMKDLYKDSQNVYNGLNTSCIENLFETELKLRNYIISILENNDFKYNNDLEELFIKFVRVSMNFDARKPILDIKHNKEFPTIEVVADALKNDGNKFFENLAKKKNYNLLLSYAYLHIMLKQERDIINNYQSIIKSL